MNIYYFAYGTNLNKKIFLKKFKESPLADLEIVSLVHPKKHINQIFANIPKEGIIGVEKEPYADTIYLPDMGNGRYMEICLKIQTKKEPMGLGNNCANLYSAISFENIN